MWSALQIAAMALAFLWFYWSGRARLRGCLLVAFPFAGVGALGLGMLLRVPAWIRSGFETAVLVHDADFMAHGALLGLVIAYAVLARRRGFEPWSALDSLAAPLGIMVCVARIGCFVAGCDHGTITGIPWAVRYPGGPPRSGVTSPRGSSTLRTRSRSRFTRRSSTSRSSA